MHLLKKSFWFIIFITVASVIISCSDDDEDASANALFNITFAENDSREAGETFSYQIKETDFREDLRETLSDRTIQITVNDNDDLTVSWENVDGDTDGPYGTLTSTNEMVLGETYTISGEITLSNNDEEEETEDMTGDWSLEIEVVDTTNPPSLSINDVNTHDSSQDYTFDIPLLGTTYAGYHENDGLEIENVASSTTAGDTNCSYSATPDSNTHFGTITCPNADLQNAIGTTITGIVEDAAGNQSGEWSFTVIPDS